LLNIINVFSVTFDQLNASLLNESVNLNEVNKLIYCFLKCFVTVTLQVQISCCWITVLRKQKAHTAVLYSTSTGVQ